jgi:signal transduction histidine kinase
MSEDNSSDLSSSAQREHATRRLAALGEMTGGIVHDFRNVLAAISSGLSLLERNSEQSGKSGMCIAEIRKEIARGMRLVSQLLAFAKQQEFKARPGDVNEFLRNMEIILKYGAGFGVRIMFSLQPDLPKCMIDEAQFHSVVVNLIVNARDAMPNGGEVQISTERCVIETATVDSLTPGIYVRVRVKDSGKGMPPDVLQKVFDPLFTTKGDDGTGLGLPQVFAFMHLIGGHVKISSQVGVGTTVDLLFLEAKTSKLTI